MVKSKAKGENYMWESFVQIFTGPFSWLTITLICVGIVLCLVEAVMPGFGIFGILGIMCEVGAVVTNAIVSGDPIQVLILFLLVTLITLLIFLLFVRSARFGVLGKTPFVENRSSISVNYGKDQVKKLNELVGKEGIATTECRPIGKVRINQEIYEVRSKNTMIKKGEVVRVIEIEDTIIVVDKLSY